MNESGKDVIVLQELFAGKTIYAYDTCLVHHVITTIHSF